MAFELEFVNQYQGRIPIVTAKDNPLYTGALGNPVYSNLDISGGSYTDDNGSSVSFQAVRIDTVLMIVNQSKSIVKTDVQGADGTVKEYIALGDYQINISMILAGEQGVYPRDVVDNLIRMLNAPVPLVVNSWYLAMFGIYNIVVDSYSFPQLMGGQSQQNVEITAISDIPTILLING